ncbi:hypothetical protein U6B65_14580 [Oscillospiraceae bacterium MB08-C2-2]|nr:hypothetical protein U6B65_14580 [Oscillospiraceae bacterium MB08-C2-2]
MATTYKNFNWVTERGARIVAKIAINNYPAGENAADEWVYTIERLSVNDEIQHGQWNPLKKTIDFQSQGQMLHILLPELISLELFSREKDYFHSRRQNFGR